MGCNTAPYHPKETADDVLIKCLNHPLIVLPLYMGGIFYSYINNSSSRSFRYAYKTIRSYLMQTLNLAGATASGSFNAITSIQHSRQHILTGADFKQPRVKSLLERLVEFLNQKVQP
ncbi:hypothetical protein DFQ50_108299 [Pseudocitrobacter faecalis]|uniref:Uncharacterized protein n=2 Tax=Pseudocitrobacter faecalis TaxID=1398493 RepID=A0ABX9FTR6_9ENTR|nr:hypothetical protein DFQ50_108299 [Pseudocitrobacter faecalis]